MSISPVAVQRDEVQRDLWTRTAEAAGRLNRAQGELVDLAAEVIEGGHWGDGGFRSPEHYFVVRAGLSPAHARDVVAIATRQRELPAASEAGARSSRAVDRPPGRRSRAASRSLLHDLANEGGASLHVHASSPEPVP